MEQWEIEFNEWWQKFGIERFGEDAVFYRACHAGWKAAQPSILTFEQLRRVNLTRARRWHTSPEGIREWVISEWTNAMAGEAGEACNAAKKLRRIECKMQQHGGDSGVPANMEEARRKVLKEVGDTVIYADLVCQRVGGTMGEAVRMAFNQVSEREGFPERLP